MTATAHKIEEQFKKLPAEEQAELFSRLETIIYDEEEADRISQERNEELASGKVKPISKQEVMRRVRARLP